VLAHTWPFGTATSPSHAAIFEVIRN